MTLLRAPLFLDPLLVVAQCMSNNCGNSLFNYELFDDIKNGKTLTVIEIYMKAVTAAAIKNLFLSPHERPARPLQSLRVRRL